MLPLYIFFFLRMNKITHTKNEGNQKSFSAKFPLRDYFLIEQNFFFCSMVKIRKRYWIIKVRGWKKLRYKFAFLICINKRKRNETLSKRNYLFKLFFFFILSLLSFAVSLSYQFNTQYFRINRILWGKLFLSIFVCVVYENS